MVVSLNVVSEDNVNERLGHMEKAESPISVTELGITTDCSKEHPEKAPFPIAVTESGIDIYSELFKQEINLPELSIRRPSISLNDVSEDNVSESLGHLEKAPSPRALTE